MNACSHCKSAAYSAGQRFILEQIQTLQKNGEARLPPLHVCATRAGISHPTMSKVIGDLRRNGVVRVSRRFGICLAEAVPAGALETLACPETHPPAALRGEHLINKLRNVLQLSQSPDGVVAPVKELAAQCCVCEQTIRKGLATLAARGVLSRNRNRFTLRRQRALSVRSQVVLVARGGDFAQVSLATPRTREHLLVLEHQCAQRGIDLVLNTLYFRGVEWQGVDSLRTILGNSVQPLLGICIWTAGLGLPILDKVLAVTKSAGLAVVVLDDAGLVTKARQAEYGSQMQVYALGTTARCGSICAQYLLDMGHRHFAFVRTNSNTAFDKREEGFRQACRDSDSGAQVHTIMLEAPEPTALQTVQQRRAELLPTLRSLLSKPTGSGIDISLEDRFVSDLFFSLESLIHSQSERTTLFPKLEQLLSAHSCSAWVGASDSIALNCLDFLRIRQIPVPQEISVLGFDDSIEAFSNKITSYNFNGQGVVISMLNALLYPNLQGLAPQELDGFITERYTCGVAAPLHTY